MKWFKFYGQDWLTDIKILRLKIEDRLCYLTLLCIASASEDRGTIKNCDEDAIIKLTQLSDNPYDDDNEYSRAKGFLSRLNDNGMITIDNDGSVTINNFLKRQGTNLSGYERVKRYREKHKKPTENIGNSITDNNDNVHDNANDNVRIDKIRKEKNTYSEDFLDHYFTEYKKKIGDNLPVYSKRIIIPNIEAKAEMFGGYEKLKKLLAIYFKQDNKFYRENKWSLTCFLSENILNKLNG